MRGGVVLKLSCDKEVGPGLGIVGAEDPKVGFDFLVGSFGLSIGLRVIGSGESDVIVEKMDEFSGKG